VNSQLLLHGVQFERDEQVLHKERKKVHRMKHQMEFDEDCNQRYRSMLAKQIQYELDLEKQAEADARRRSTAKNDEMLPYRESLAAIEDRRRSRGTGRRSRRSRD
jgi:hypothetical protein